VRSGGYSPRENLERILGLILLVGTIGTYWHLQLCDFIRFDDPFYVTANNHVRSGFNRANVIWAFTTFDASNWHPLTWLSHMLDCSLFGLNPAGHHLTNLFLHLGSTLLLFLFFREATNQTWRSFIVAALFALHPLHVESVTWVSERKDVLSAFFWMFALVAYARYAQRSGATTYLAVLLLFALGLMAKPMVVTFPLVLLLLDYWPLGRTGPLSSLPFVGKVVRMSSCTLPVPIPSREGRIASLDSTRFSLEEASQRGRWGYLLWEKFPFFLLSAASCVVTYLAQTEGRAIRTLEVIPFVIRVENALVSYLRYILNMLWPHNLTIFYPHPVHSLEPWLVSASALLLAGVSVAAVHQASRHPYFIVGWLWYLGTLVPVIGLVQVGNQGMADRYTYIPLIGLFVAVVWGISDFFERWRVRRLFTVSFVCAVCFALIVTTKSQLRYWQNDYTLFEQALRVTRNNYLAHLLLAQVASMDGNPDKSLFHRQKAVEINPAFVAMMHNRWGYYQAEQGQLDEAISEFAEAIQIRPDYANAHNNLGVVLERKGQLDEAIASFLEALRISPENVRVRKSLEIVEREKSQFRAPRSESPQH
jgi:protein O-mannosyl-transferase